MPTLRTTVATDDPTATAWSPRDDLMVHEREMTRGHFVGDAGPWRVWERSVELDTTSGTTIQTIRYGLDAPHWGWLVNQLLRHPVRRGLPPGSRPPWSPTVRLSPSDSRILSLCATLSLIAGFLGALIIQTIAYVADDFAHGSGSTTSSQATALTVIRFGAIITFAVTSLADRVGRRPVLMATLIGAAVASTLTALAPSLAVVTGLQLIARGLVAAAAFIIPIVLAEELPPQTRSYGIGLMLLPGGLGAGIVVWMLKVVDIAPYAWRFLFLLSFIAIIVVRATVVRLPETKRFEHEDREPTERSTQRIKVSRLLILAGAMLLLNVYAAPTQQLQTDYLKNSRSFGAGEVSIFMVLTNTWAFLGVGLGAQLADRRSRRLAAVIGLIGLTVGNTLMFQVSGWPMWVFSTLGSAVGATWVPAIGAILPEVFPTLRRGVANGIVNATAVLGGAVGLQVAGHFVTDNNYGPTVAALAICPALAALLMMFMPETSGRDLDDLNPHSPSSNRTQ